ncbi:hypothetical protein BTA51_01970 [Hahella sp. CCB-MM4]|uniref:hypothetical protein n=1 Tax=Hahella sp. (strain CCB-MM4) TaxID=1926491 RepID=UPI000B9C20F0|nr:hypothetical protein [Hahella sp. CCB-MM4]OZG75175.1 hypothetical protein BTA51_01970 [Hahella sp. CCB-MM4]
MEMKAFVGTNEFGEVLHIAALAAAMSIKNQSMVVKIIPADPREEKISVEQARRFLAKFGVQAFQAKSQSSDDLVPGKTTETIYQLLSDKGSSTTMRIGIRDAFRRVCQPGSDSEAAGEISKLFGKGYKKDKVLVWVRKNHEGGRGMSEDALKQLTTEIKRAGLVPVLAGDKPTKPIARALNLVDLQRGYYENDESYVKQGALLSTAQKLGVFASVGMMSGGMDFGAFLGIPTVNITPSKTSGDANKISDRMKALAEVTFTKNVGFSSADYNSGNKGSSLPRVVIQQAMSHINDWKRRDAEPSGWWS